MPPEHRAEIAEARSFFARSLAILRANLKEGHPAIAVAQQHLEALPLESPSQKSIEDKSDLPVIDQIHLHTPTKRLTPSLVTIPMTL